MIWEESVFLSVSICYAFFLELHQVFFLVFKTSVIFIKVGLGLGSKYYLEDVVSENILSTLFSMCYYDKLFGSICWFSLNFIKTLIRCSKLVLGFYIKIVFRGWIFKGESKHFIISDFWWKLIKFIKLGLGFGIKVSFRRCRLTEGRGTTSFPMYSGENVFDIYFKSALNCLNYFVVLIIGSEVDGVL